MKHEVVGFVDDEGLEDLKEGLKSMDELYDDDIKREKTETHTHKIRLVVEIVEE